MRKPIGEISIYTKDLYEFLIKVEVKGRVSYKELGDVVDLDIPKEGRGYLTSARRIAERDNGIVFDTIAGWGLERMDDVDIVNKTSASTISKIRNTAKKGARRLTKVNDFDALPKDLQNKHNATVTYLLFTSHASKPKQLKRLEDKVDKVGEVLTAKQTLKALTGIDKKASKIRKPGSAPTK